MTSNPCSTAQPSPRRNAAAFPDSPGPRTLTLVTLASGAMLWMMPATAVPCPNESSWGPGISTAWPASIEQGAAGGGVCQVAGRLGTREALEAAGELGRGGHGAGAPRDLHQCRSRDPAEQCGQLHVVEREAPAARLVDDLQGPGDRVVSGAGNAEHAGRAQAEHPG